MHQNYDGKQYIQPYPPFYSRKISGRANRWSIKKPLAEILTYLDDGGSVSSTEEPIRVYLTCYKALDVLDNPRANQILQQAYNMLQAQAARLPNPEIRKAMIENIPFHHEIVIAWEKQQHNL